METDLREPRDKISSITFKVRTQVWLRPRFQQKSVQKYPSEQLKSVAHAVDVMTKVKTLFLKKEVFCLNFW